jgi:tetratricopeptide (TPR) repeat protein
MKIRIPSRAFLFVAVAVAFAREPTWEDLIRAGAASERTGDYAAAVRSYGNAASIAAESRDHRLAQTLHILANAKANCGKWADAERDYRRALGLVEFLAGAGNPDYAFILAGLGVNYWDSGEFNRAEPTLRRAIQIYRSTVSDDDPRLAMARNSLAVVMLSRGRYDEAGVLLRTALTVFRRSEELAAQRAAALTNLGVVYLHSGRLDEAVRFIGEAIQLTESRLGPDHPALIRSLNDLATASDLAGRPHEARAALERALRIAENQPGRSHPTYGGLLLNLAAFERKAGRKAEAKRLEEKARSVLRGNASANGVGMTIDASYLRDPR